MDDKDALDIWRLLQAIETSKLTAALLKLVDVDVARDVTREALVGEIRDNRDAILRGLCSVHADRVVSGGPLPGLMFTQGQEA